MNFLNKLFSEKKNIDCISNDKKILINEKQNIYDDYNGIYEIKQINIVLCYLEFDITGIHLKTIFVGKNDLIVEVIKPIRFGEYSDKLLI